MSSIIFKIIHPAKGNLAYAGQQHVYNRHYLPIRKNLPPALENQSARTEKPVAIPLRQPVSAGALPLSAYFKPPRKGPHPHPAAPILPVNQMNCRPKGPEKEFFMKITAKFAAAASAALIAAAASAFAQGTDDYNLPQGFWFYNEVSSDVVKSIGNISTSHHDGGKKNGSAPADPNGADVVADGTNGATTPTGFWGDTIAIAASNTDFITNL